MKGVFWHYFEPFGCPFVNQFNTNRCKCLPMTVSVGRPACLSSFHNGTLYAIPVIPGMLALLPTTQLVPAAVMLDAGLHTIPRESHIVSHQIAILFQAFLFSRSAGLELCLRDQREKLQRDKPQRDKLQDRLQQPLRRLQQPR